MNTHYTSITLIRNFQQLLLAGNKWSSRNLNIVAQSLIWKPPTVPACFPTIASMNSNATEGVRRFSWNKAEFKIIWIISSSSILWYDIIISKRSYIPFEAVARSVEVSELKHKKSRKHGAQLKNKNLSIVMQHHCKIVSEPWNVENNRFPDSTDCKLRTGLFTTIFSSKLR